LKSKREIIEEISEKLEVSREEAADIFSKAMKSGDIRRIYDWKRIVDAVVIVALVVATFYALIKIILSYIT
tara:strand:- start:51 stop:263 length:213 start_codon:yes stop_codon:yes gene_type:complete